MQQQLLTGGETVEIRLQKLMLTNFKGIKSLTLGLNGRNASIYGANATGKTTIYDAFLWLLFDKDSQNKSTFNIKTLDSNGEPLHGLDHEVEAVLSVDGRELTLKKSYKEKWTKKRGSAQAEFTGHTTDYAIDGVPAKKSEYDATISGLIDEDAFKLLTNPTYFSEQLQWQDRRCILLEVCGDVSTEDVVASDEELSRLTAILAGRSVEAHTDLIKSRMRDINRELEHIPMRIDEATRALPKVEAAPEALREDIRKAEEAIQDYQEKLAELRAGGAVAAKTKQLNELDAEIAKLQTETYSELDKAVENKWKELQTVLDAIADCEQRIFTIGTQIASLAEGIRTSNMLVEALRKQWHEVNGQQWQGDETCPTCGQALPDEQIEEAKARFNRHKAETLEHITHEGKQTAKQIEEHTKSLQNAEAAKQEQQAELERLRQQEAELRAEMKELKSSQVEIPGLAERQAQRDRLVTELRGLQLDQSEAISDLEKSLGTMRTALQALRGEEEKLKLREQGQQRIEELKARERQLAAEYEKLEAELYLCEQFERTRANLLEDRVSQHFELARFRLFNKLVNGALEPCCEVMFGGVPYSDLNKAAKVNIGLDIIRTLSRHYGSSAPIFIDNAEAVCELLPAENAQLIRLVVSPDDKILRIERE
jgi:DNA repair exonuclease SbcCD ATPase subunit